MEVRNKNIFKIIGAYFLLGLMGPNIYAQENTLYIITDSINESLIISRSKDKSDSVLTQVVKAGIRPYIHPIAAPDGDGVLTEYGPGHHLHQTGLYWGLKRVNERDFFMNWKQDYWKKESSTVLEHSGEMVKWQTKYGLLNEKGEVILDEVQQWSMEEREGSFILDLEWQGSAREDVTMGEFYVGGLFLRMPWKKGYNAEIVNSDGKKNLEAEAQRAIWADVGIQVPGRTDLAHIAMMDHPDNRAFPTPWRVDSQFGLGPSIQILGDWKIPKGSTETIKYRLLIYTGNRDNDLIARTWKEFVCEEL
ncbi:MAG: PmoA family protein [Flavobacteriaceae bacterium]|nr:PmoA family protein [Flavobacteriaceae bacterium]